jgi:hypothetical protein
MDKLKCIKEMLINTLIAETGDLSKVDAKEMGEVVDMVKDIAETEYYCTITEAMHANEEEPIYEHNRYYDPYRDIDRDRGRMYYGDPSSRHPDSRNRDMYPNPMARDYREGRSPTYRKMYMEAKEMKHGKEMQMKELEQYMQELTSDIVDMIHDASADEKALLHKKV